MRIIESLTAYAALTSDERLSSYLVEDLVAAIALERVDEPLVDLRTIDVSDVLIFDSSLVDARLRLSAAHRLLSVGDILRKKGFILDVFECYRSYEKQKREFEDVSMMMRAEYSHLTGKELWRKVTEFIADPDLCPPHLTGGAVDVRLRRFDGTIVDMGTEINSILSAAALVSAEITSDAAMNRRVLLNSFLDAGFAPMPSEWWHFSYGDRYWGAFYDRPAMYDTIRS